jgi:hypothetical protein
MATYNPAEIQAIADKLEAQADAAMIHYPTYGAALAGLTAAAWSLQRGIVSLPIGIAILGGIVGFRLARIHSLALRAQAQSLLCQLKIEENTRK